MTRHDFDGPDCGVDGCRREVGHIGDHHNGEPRDSLDAAWAEAEAALPEGEPDLFLERHSNGCFASTTPDGPGPIGEGPTPTAALRSLAERLREAS